MVGLFKFLADKFTPTAEAKTISDALDRYAREEIPKLGERTQKDYARHIARIRAWCGHMRLDELQKKDVGRFLNPEGVTRGLVHRARTIAVLSAMYNKAVKAWFICDANPCNVEKRKANKRQRYVTDDEFKIVYDAMPTRIQIAMDLALICGQRQGDILSLKWSDVTDDGVLFTPAKTKKKVGKRLMVGMSTALKAVLDRAKRLLPEVPREYVIRTQDGGRFTPEGFRSPWQRRMRRLVNGYWRGHKGRKPVWIEPQLKERFTFHDLRAKTVSDSKSLEEAFERAGHTDMSMTRGVYDRNVRKVTPLR
jgi:integrase